MLASVSAQWLAGVGPLEKICTGLWAKLTPESKPEIWIIGTIMFIHGEI